MSISIMHPDVLDVIAAFPDNLTKESLKQQLKDAGLSIETIEIGNKSFTLIGMDWVPDDAVYTLAMVK